MPPHCWHVRVIPVVQLISDGGDGELKRTRASRQNVHKMNNPQNRYNLPPLPIFVTCCTTTVSVKHVLNANFKLVFQMETLAAIMGFH